MVRLAMLVLTLAVAVALGGCSLSGSRSGSGSGGGEGGGGGGPSVAHRSPTAHRPTVPRGTPAAAAAAALARTHEVPTPAPPQTVAGGWRSPVQAVQVFATTYINWSAATVASRLKALARVSVGQARSAMALAASQTGRDYELERGGIANSGVVEAIAPVAGHAREYAVVTRERTTASRGDAYRGLAPSWHLALATVTRTAGGLWVLSAWLPEN